MSTDNEWNLISSSAVVAHPPQGLTYALRVAFLLTVVAESGYGLAYLVTDHGAEMSLL